MKRLTFTLFVLTVLLLVASPITAQLSFSPVISWPGDPGSTIAITWIGSDVAAVDLELANGTVKTVDGSVAYGVSQVIIDGLASDTAYHYRVAGDTAWHAFRTQPAGPAPIQFAVLGDLQPFNDETDRTTRMVMEKVASLDPAFMLQVGDLAEIGLLKGSWERALDALTVAAADHPIVPAAGNHDYFYVIPSARFFKSIFPAPYVETAIRRDTWYSATVGPVHVAVLDTEARGRAFDNQLEWLVGDLEEARAKAVSWLFLLMHRPIFSTATGSEDEKWAQHLLPIVAENRVAAVFWGHDHLFEHYEYAYGDNGYMFDPAHGPAVFPTHFFTVGSAGARVDSLYGGFFTHKPFIETWTMYRSGNDDPVEFEFAQRPWNTENALRVEPRVRYQDPAVYQEAASYFHYPFENRADALAGRYSDDPRIRYCDDSEFFGYTYGESSIHYLWVEVEGDTCTISAHYANGLSGEHGTPIASPDGLVQRWVISR